MFNYSKQLKIGYQITSALFSLIFTINLYYFLDEYTIPIWARIALLIVQLCIFYTLSVFVYYLIDKATQLPWIEKDKALVIARERHRYRMLITTMSVLMIAWLPLLVIKYPGASCYDTNQMLLQFREGTVTTHHSVFYTLSIGETVKCFESIGHPNWGLFIFVIAHYLLMAFAFGYASNYLWLRGTKRKVLIGVLATWLLNPFIFGYIGVAIKDIPYAAGMVILTVLFMEISDNEEAFIRSYTKIVLLVITVVLCCLVRRNGVYVAVIALVFMIAKALRKRVFVKYAVVMGTSILLFAGINTTVSHQLKAEKSSMSQMLSLPLQQTARYVSLYENEVSDLEKEVIDSVIVYDMIRSSYKPYIADPIKNIYRNNDKNLPAYFKVWAKQFKRHPICYVAAACEMYYYAFLPAANADNISLYRDCEFGVEKGDSIDLNKFGLQCDCFSQPKVLKDTNNWVFSLERKMYDNPLVGLISNISVCTWVMLFLFSKLLVDHKACGLAYLSSLCALLFALVGPVIYGHPRYFFPIIYVLPVLALYSLQQYSKLT